MTSKELKAKMGFTRKLDLHQVRRWLTDHSYEMKVMVQAERWACKTGRFCGEWEMQLDRMSPSQYISLVVKAHNLVSEINYFSQVNAVNAWRKVLS